MCLEISLSLLGNMPSQSMTVANTQGFHPLLQSLKIAWIKTFIPPTETLYIKGILQMQQPDE